MPWLPTIDWQKYRQAVAPLVDLSSFDLTRTLVDAAGWLVVAHALRALVDARSVVALSLGVMATALASQVVIVDNVLSLEEAVGAVAAAALLRWTLRPSPRRAATGLALLLAVTLLLDGLQPYVFSSTPTHFGWIPLQGVLASGSPLGSLASWLQKLFGYCALVWLLRQAGLPWLLVAGLVTGLSSGIEVVQCWVPGRTPEITDPLVAATVAVLTRGASGDSALHDHERTPQS